MQERCHHIVKEINYVNGIPYPGRKKLFFGTEDDAVVHAFKSFPEADTIELVSCFWKELRAEIIAGIIDIRKKSQKL